ncbi:MAG TPA: SMP-30/gluconolactonase/LRE family protein [Thermoanaerobaculia bacterium]|nr:SMP-30/gluconolactonase/LRE family protein [Thermoanaerobaculia bacterium]
MGVFLRILVGVAVAGGLWFLYLYDAAGQFRKLEPLSAGVCRAVTGAAGAEDIALDRGAATALVSSDPRTGDRGALYAYSLDPGAGDRLVDLTADLPGELRPHGISLLARESGGGTLFVVNHTTSGDAVDVFAWQPNEAGGTLEPLRSVRDPLLVSVNDVAAVDDVRFYATNDHGSASRRRQALDDYLRLSRANVVYWDGSSARVVASRIAYANGIALSQNGEELYVAATTKGEILVYDRDLESGDLELRKAIATGTGVDNLTVDMHGDLWIGAHPHLFSFLRHAGDPSRRSPSEVVWVDPDGLAEPPVRPVWRSLGEDLSGSSVAVPFGSRILIGSVFEPHFLVCDRNATRSG